MDRNLWCILGIFAVALFWAAAIAFGNREVVRRSIRSGYFSAKYSFMPVFDWITDHLFLSAIAIAAILIILNILA